MKKLLIRFMLFWFVVFLILPWESADACTYEDALNADWGNYSKADVVRILNEDMTEESDLAPNQKMRCLIGPMQEFYKDFDKESNGIKYEALCAISAMETGHFKSDVCNYYNNVGGMLNSKGYMQFDTKSDGIKALAKLLLKEYLDPKGKYHKGNKIVDIGQHYNQSLHWVVTYVKIRLDMEGRIEGIEPKYDEKIKKTSCSSFEISEPVIRSGVWSGIGKIDSSHQKYLQNILPLYLGSNPLSKVVLPCNTRKKFQSTEEKL